MLQWNLSLNKIKISCLNDVFELLLSMFKTDKNYLYISPTHYIQPYFPEKTYQFKKKLEIKNGSE